MALLLRIFFYIAKIYAKICSLCGETLASRALKDLLLRQRRLVKIESAK